MRRLLDFLLRNWPLKLAAIGLAVVLYAGVTLSGNERTWPGSVAIEVLDPPPGAAVLDLPGSVTMIRYRAPIEASSQLTTGSFLASIDLADVTPAAGGPPVPVDVRVTAIDPRVQVIDFTPRSVNVRVDQVVSRPMSVTVDRGTVPEGLTLGAPQVSPPTVVVRGASSRVAAVQSVVARVAIDASGLNVDQDVDLEAIDETGAPVPGVEVIPQRVHVSIDVARELAYATLPVVPVIHGAPAAGYRVSSVRADPQTLTVSGEAAAVERLSSISTQPLDISGVTEDCRPDRGRGPASGCQPGGRHRRPAARDGGAGRRLAHVAGGRPGAGRPSHAPIRVVHTHRPGDHVRAAAGPRCRRPVYHRGAYRGGPAGSRHT